MRISIKSVSLGILFSIFLSGTASAVQAADQQSKKQPKNETSSTAIDLKSQPKSYWRQKLDSNTYNVTRCSATEVPFTGKYWNEHSQGDYTCSNCGEKLFDSKDKFDSGTGWPSFSSASKGSVEVKEDRSLGMKREEVVCKHCGAHLGHLFEDGPKPTGQRYCINSASLDLKSKK